MAADNQAALDALFAACEAAPACRERHPALRAHWRGLLGGLPVTARVAHPVTGQPETVTFTRSAVASAVRSALYSPAMSAALPEAIEAAREGRFEPLAALSSSVGGRRGVRVAAGMHFSVVCAEDAPRMTDAAPSPAAPDFGVLQRELYAEVCAQWPRASVPPAFYAVPPAPAPVLLLSGGIDPATPPRHAERTAQALGPRARHVVVPNAGHGVLGLACMRDVLFRFIDAHADDRALAVDAGCAQRVPRPPAFVPMAEAAP
jgi:pimeloyl-ACP methyl ester carboxylesterase